MADAKCGSSAAQMIARTSSKGKEKMEGQSRYTNSTDFFSRSNLSYGDYLQAQQFENSIRFAIRDQTKSIIGSDEALAHQQYVGCH